MEILFGGVGDAFSTDNYGTHFFVRSENGFLLAVDCPDSYRRAMKENAFPHKDGTLDVGDIDAMFITHLHGDHINGLEMVLFYRMFITKKKLKLFTTQEVAKVLWEKRLEVSLGTIFDGEIYQKTQLNDFVELHIVDWGKATECGPFKLTTRKTIHHIPTAALRITEKDRTFGYSCDTAFDPTLIEWLKDADTILHETSFGPAHTPLFSLLELPESIRRKLWVAHLPDELNGEETELLRFAHQGLKISI